MEPLLGLASCCITPITPNTAGVNDVRRENQSSGFQRPEAGSFWPSWPDMVRLVGLQLGLVRRGVLRLLRVLHRLPVHLRLHRVRSGHGHHLLLLLVHLRGSSRFESLILSHHSR